MLMLTDQFMYMCVFNIGHADFISGNMKMYIAFSIISQPWDGAQQVV